MKIPAIPRLALRALNETRRVDLFSYLSLRYTLTSTISFKNVWAQQIAPEIVRRRPGQTFLESKQFKQRDKSGDFEFRELLRPGGPEILAEVALLEACAKAGGLFSPPETVYSYNFPKSNSIVGAYLPYFDLFSARQNDIGQACRKKPGQWVLYADIRKFYPSVKYAKAAKAWQKACEKSSLASDWKAFGSLLLKRQFSLKKGMLVGPLFSHLIGNLILREVDAKMGKAFPGRYFRYVDDFAVVVSARKKKETLSRLRAALKPLGLKLHPQKLHWIQAKQWEEHAPYQTDEYDNEYIGDEKWMRFIDHLKCFLMANPQVLEKIRTTFLAAELRVPLPRYTGDAMSKSYGNRFNERLKSVDFVVRLKQINPKELLGEGLSLRRHYEEEFQSVWVAYCSTKGLIRRWKLSKVRYLLGRIFLIGSIDKVRKIYQLIRKESEVAEYAAMFEALVKRNADALLPFGWKVAASAGQVLAAASISISSKSKGWQDEHIEAYATLLLTGAVVDAKIPKRLEDDPRIRIVLGHTSADAWAKMPCSFYRELSALIGGKKLEDHQKLLQTPADPDERWEVFADELLGLDQS